MASKIPGTNDKVYLHYKGMNELMKSWEIRQILEERMAAVQAAVPGSTMTSLVRPSRVVTIVKFGSDFDEANTGNLSRALDLSGGLRGTKKKFGSEAKAKRRANG